MKPTSGTSGPTGASETSRLAGLAGLAGTTGLTDTTGLLGTGGTTGLTDTTGLLGTGGTSGLTDTTGLVGTGGTSGLTVTGGPTGATGLGGATRLTGAARRWALAALIGAAGAVIVGGWLGLPAGLAAALIAQRYLRRITPARYRAEQRRAAADLPFAADLLAAALRAGLPVDRAVRIVAGALDGPVGDRLARAGRSLDLGLSPDLAWSGLAELPGGDRLVTAVRRSTHSGAALAAAFVRLADDQRAGRQTAAEAAGQRASVLIVLPLGLCFLPAFVFAGIVPVIVAVLGDVLR